MKRQFSALRAAKKNLYLVMSESAITAGIMAMSVLTPFFNSIGLDQGEIALTQIIFTLVLMFLNIPTGYIADRMSRKWANIIGDFGHGVLLLTYAMTQNFVGVVICESMMGVASALSGGVDQSLLKHFSGKIAKQARKPESQVLKTNTARLECAKYACTLFLLVLGGPIGAIDLRLAIALSSVPKFIGGIISIFIDDDSEKLVPVHKNPMRDMARVMKTALSV